MSDLIEMLTAPEPTTTLLGTGVIDVTAEASGKPDVLVGQIRFEFRATDPSTWATLTAAEWERLLDAILAPPERPRG